MGQQSFTYKRRRKKKKQKDKRNRQGAQNAIDLQSHAQMNPMNWFFMNSES
jgi:hypothetical protein